MTNTNWPETAKIRLTGAYWQEGNEGRDTETVYDAWLDWEDEARAIAYYHFDPNGTLESAALIGDEDHPLAAEFVTGPEAHPAGGTA